MIALKDGRADLHQWDTGRILAVDPDINELHFAKNPMGRSLDVDATGGEARIPDVLLQTPGNLHVWAFVGTPEDGYTKVSKIIKIQPRNKPADYVFTPQEQTTLKQVMERLDRVPVDIENALAEAKASGEFDGEDGKTPYIKEGYWWVGDQNTGVKAQGRPGSDANVTSENIKNALGYVPAKQSEIPSVPVQSVNGKVGDVKLEAADVGAATKEQVDQISKEIADLDESKADGIVESATGKVIAVSDSADAPLRGLTVYGKSTQNGTPTPDAPVPIVSVGGDGVTDVGVYGANLFNPDNLNDRSGSTNAGYTITNNKDGTFTATADGTTTVVQNLTSKKAFVLPVGNYFISGGGTYKGATESTVYVVVAVKKLITGGTQYINGSNKVPVTELSEIRIYIQVAAGFNGTETLKPMLNVGSTALPWEPYTAQTLPISTPDGLCGIPVSSGGNYTDENGQMWVCDEVDFVRGVRVQRIYEKNITANDIKKAYIINLTSDEWQISGAHAIYFSGVIHPIPIDSTGKTCLSDRFAGTGYKFSNSEVPGTLFVRGNVTYLRIADELTGIVAEDTKDVKIEKILTFIESIGVFTIQYRLATPIETPLTESELAAYKALYTNHPNTTIYADDNAGLAVQYKADTKLYIDKKFDALAAAVLANA